MTPEPARGHDLRTLWRVIHVADTVTIRLLLAWASLFYAVCLVVPGFFTGLVAFLRFLLFMPSMPPLDPVPVFERAPYAFMALIPGGEWTWAAFFTIHFLGVHWRIVDKRERVRWALAINCLGFCTWAYSTLSINLAVGTIGPQTALEWVLVAFSGWALYRTGLSKELVTQ